MQIVHFSLSVVCLDRSQQYYQLPHFEPYGFWASFFPEDTDKLTFHDYTGTPLKLACPHAVELAKDARIKRLETIETLIEFSWLYRSPVDRQHGGGWVRQISWGKVAADYQGVYFDPAIRLQEGFHGMQITDPDTASPVIVKPLWFHYHSYNYVAYCIWDLSAIERFYPIS